MANNSSTSSQHLQNQIQHQQQASPVRALLVISRAVIATQRTRLSRQLSNFHVAHNGYIPEYRTTYFRCGVDQEEFLSAGRVVAPRRHQMKRGRVRCNALAAPLLILLWARKRFNSHPLPPPPFRSLYLSRYPCDNLTVFELETSELDNRCEILQVSTCLFSNPGVSFSVCALSTRQISLDATAVSHFSFARASGHIVLLRNGIKVLAVCSSVAEEFFCEIGLVNLPHCHPPLLHTTNSLLMHVLLQHTSSTFRSKVSRFGRQQIQPLRSSYCDQGTWSWYCSV